MYTILNILLSGIVVGISSYLIPWVSVDWYITAIIVAVVLSLVNGTIWVILKILTFPLNILTLWLMSLIINVLMILLVAKVVPWFTVNWFWIALIFAIILSIVNVLIKNMFLDNEKK